MGLLYLLPHNIWLCNELRKNEIGKACAVRMEERRKMRTKFWSEKLEKRDFLKRLIVDEIIILILIHILKKYIDALYTNHSFNFRWRPDSLYLFTNFVVMIVLKTICSCKTVQRLYSVINVRPELEIKELKTTEA